jgi:endothelin-converting enzyme/putative endopeptidase
MKIKSFCLFLFLSFTSLAGQKTFHAPLQLDPLALSEDVDPCVNFYEFACNSWIKNTVIPEDKSAVSRSATALSDSIDLQIDKLLVDYSKGNYRVPGKYAQSLGTYYKSCLESDKHSGESRELVNQKLAEIKDLKNLDELAKLVGEYHRLGMGILFGISSTQDVNNSEKVILDLGQGGMGLGTREYYFETTDKFIETRQRYVEHIGNMFVLLGETKENAKTIAESILKMETFLATKALTIVQLADPHQTDHLLPMNELDKMAPHFNWADYFKTVVLDLQN